MSQTDINNKKAIEAIRKAYKKGKICRSEAHWLLGGVKI
jgi:hypothetical protein